MHPDLKAVVEIQQLDQQVAELSARIDSLPKEIQTLQSQLDGEKTPIAAEIKRPPDERQNGMDELERLQTRRKEVAATLAESVLALYERIRSYRPDPAVAEVRNGLCMACNIQLRRQAYNELRTGETLMTCDNCSRIIYTLENPPSMRVTYDSEGLRTINITRSEMDKLKELQRVHRWNWPATFSTNSAGEIWPFMTHSITPFELREYVQGLSEVVDTVAKYYRVDRPKGGRFFISEAGAFYRDDTADTPPELIRVDNSPLPLRVNPIKLIARFQVSEAA